MKSLMWMPYLAVFMAFLYIIRGMLNWTNPVDTQPTHVCKDCGTKRSGVTRGRPGWTYLFFPLNLLVEKKTQRCPKCGGRLLPLDSPKGQQI